MVYEKEFAEWERALEVVGRYSGVENGKLPHLVIRNGSNKISYSIPFDSFFKHGDGSIWIGDGIIEKDIGWAAKLYLMAHEIKHHKDYRDGRIKLLLSALIRKKHKECNLHAENVVKEIFGNDPTTYYFMKKDLATVCQLL